MKKEESGVYINIGNGGFKFTINNLSQKNEDNLYTIPVLNINAGVHGHGMGEMNIRMTPERLIELGKFLISEGEKSKERYNNKDDTCGGLANSQFRVNNN